MVGAGGAADGVVVAVGERGVFFDVVAPDVAAGGGGVGLLERKGVVSGGVM